MDSIPYGQQKIEEEDIEAVSQVLRSAYLTQGPKVGEFERGISKFLQDISQDPDPIYSFAVNNGTTALHLACLALGVTTGDKVLVTGNSFVASANCVLYCGGEVEFVDISLNDFCIDVALVEAALLGAPKGTYKGIIAVDFAGSVSDLEALRFLADRHGLFILEDACHALGATRKTQAGQLYSAGGCRFSDISVFSFHPVKHLATGEGGMITTRSETLAKKLSLIRTHGITKNPEQMKRHDGGWYMEMQELGYNGRISDILCALGISQLNRLKSNLESRQKIANRYSEELKDLPIFLPVENELIKHAYHLYVIRTDQRKALYDYLLSRKIYAQVHYLPIYQHPFYQGRYGKISKPNCDLYYNTCLSIPMFHSLSEQQQDRVISEIRKFFKK